jgi:hypothetical protein
MESFLELATQQEQLQPTIHHPKPAAVDVDLMDLVVVKLVTFVEVSITVSTRVQHLDQVQAVWILLCQCS